jgi:monoamine oxidase
VARTYLLNFFQQLYRDFEEAEASGAANLNGRPWAGRNRREFLKTSGALAASTILSKPAGLLARSQPKIIIIGGGVAGLNAALTLQDAGYASTVYEASNRIGGRMHSDTTSWANGQVSEHCGELIDSSHKTILNLAKRFNIGVADVKSAQPVQSTDTFFFSNQYYLRSTAQDAFNPVYHAVKQDMNAAGYPTLYNSFNSAGLVLDNLSVYEWIESRVPCGHGSTLGQLLDVAATTEYGAETKVQSALNLVYVLASSAIPGNFPALRRSDERYHLVGGSEGLPRAIFAALPAGSIHTGVSLTSVAKNPDGTYTLGLKQGNSKFVQAADRVILALPFSVLRKLDYHAAGFNNVKVTAIQQLGYGTNAKLHLQFDERLWNQNGPWGISTGTSLADTGYQNTWDVTRAQSGATGILVDFTGGDIGASFTGDSNKPAVVQSYAIQFLTQLEQVFPGVSAKWNNRATLDTPAQNPYLLGSYSFWKIGQRTSFAGAEGERSANCHFAGEHCSINFQGFMEGAAQEGARAASEILADYKQGIFP